MENPWQGKLEEKISARSDQCLVRNLLLSLRQGPHDKSSHHVIKLWNCTCLTECKHKEALRLHPIKQQWFRNMLLTWKLTVRLHKSRHYIFINSVWPNVFTWHSPLDCEILPQPCLSLQDNKVSIEPDTATGQKYQCFWEISVFYFVIELNVWRVRISYSRVRESAQCKIRIIHVFKSYRKIMLKQKCSGTKYGTMKWIWHERLTKNKVFKSLDTGVKLNWDSHWNVSHIRIMNLPEQEHTLLWGMGNN